MVRGLLQGERAITWWEGYYMMRGLLHDEMAITCNNPLTM